MLTDKKKELTYKVQIHYNNKEIFDQNGAGILEAINKTRSLAETAKTLKVSYRYVWNYIQRIQKTLGLPVVETFKGGKDGGGGAKLTAQGKTLLFEYRNAQHFLESFASKRSEVENVKLSARNQLKGKVVEIQKGEITAKVKVEVLMPVIVTAVITKDAADELDIKVGEEVAAIVKSTEIIIAK